MVVEVQDSRVQPGLARTLVVGGNSLYGSGIQSLYSAASPTLQGSRCAPLLHIKYFLQITANSVFS